jgi:glycosyltransferase involved in cell wall biosynthesis
MKKIWIAWEKHRRTTELATAFDVAKLFQLEVEASRPIRYLSLLYRTLRIILRERPDLIIVQNPSIVLSVFMVTLGKLLVPHVVIDAHNAGIIPFPSKYNSLLPLYGMIQKWADLTIVTNEGLAKVVHANGGRPFVLEDRIPQFNGVERIALKGKHNLVFVCTFEEDEPYEEVIRAARFIDPSIHLYVTGKYQKASPTIIAQAPDNVAFTGFLSDQEYANLLYSCDAIIDLTLLEDCLVCGAYEAVALGKPLVLTNTPALRSYFYHGAVYTENTAEKIAQAIRSVVENKKVLQEEIAILRSQLKSAWEEKRQDLLRILEQLVAKRKN